MSMIDKLTMSFYSHLADHGLDFFRVRFYGDDIIFHAVEFAFLPAFRKLLEIRECLRNRQCELF